MGAYDEVIVDRHMRSTGSFMINLAYQAPPWRPFDLRQVNQGTGLGLVDLSPNAAETTIVEQPMSPAPQRGK